MNNKSYVVPETETVPATLSQVFLTLSETPIETTDRAFKRSYGKASHAFYDFDKDINTACSLVTDEGQRFEMIGELAIGQDGQEIKILDLAKKTNVYMIQKRALGDGIKHYYIAPEDADYLGQNTNMLIIYNKNTDKFILVYDPNLPIIVTVRLYNLAHYYS